VSTVSSPFRSESDAFRFVLLSVVAFAATALARLLGGAWAGVPVWAAVTVGALLLYVRAGRGGRGLRTAPPAAGDGTRRVLVLAGEWGAGEGLVRAIERGGPERVETRLVAPVRVPTLRRWVSDVDAGRTAAAARLDAALADLRAIPAANGGSRQSAVVEAVRARFALPVTRVAP
jgi:hypothetical protein